jgi:hypothetical protein
MIVRSVTEFVHNIKEYVGRLKEKKTRRQVLYGSFTSGAGPGKN